MNVKLQVNGAVPKSGLLVCNHLGYLDILVLGALAPSIFVAKRDVKHWPVFGWLAMLAGTIFVDRRRRTQVGRAGKEIDAALETGVLVVLFPEGTSSGGQTVLPFKSSLLEPVVGRPRLVSAGRIKYRLEDGDVAREVCYWEDMTFFPHLVNLLSKNVIHASVHLAESQGATRNRKELARRLRDEVLRLNNPSCPAVL